MDVTVKRADLLRELELMQGIASGKQTIPVLANMLVAATAAGLDLRVTDLEVAMRSSCEAAVAANGQDITVPARKMYELLKALPDGADLRIHASGGAVRLRSGAFDSRLQTLPAEDFPTVPGVPSGAIGTTPLPRGTLRRLLDLVGYAVTTEDTRYFLNGALLVLEADGTLRAVATDGHRLTVAAVQARGEGKPWPDAEEQAIVPRKALEELGRVLGSSTGETVAFTRGESHLFFAADGRTFLSRTIDGQFPAYKRIVPADAARVAILDRVALAAALRRVALLATTTRSVRLELSPGALRVVSSDPSVGDATEDLAAEYDGPTVAVALNGAYVKDFLDAAWTERVSLSATTDDIPTVWRPVDGDIDYLCVIMPMRV